MTIFMSPWMGDDSKDGSSAANAVRGWKRARALFLAQGGEVESSCALTIVYRDASTKTITVLPTMREVKEGEKPRLPLKMRHAMADIPTMGFTTQGSKRS